MNTQQKNGDHLAYWLRVQTVEPDNYIKILTVTYDCMIWGRLFHFFGFQFPHL